MIYKSLELGLISFEITIFFSHEFLIWSTSLPQIAFKQLANTFILKGIVGRIYSHFVTSSPEIGNFVLDDFISTITNQSSALVLYRKSCFSHQNKCIKLFIPQKRKKDAGPVHRPILYIVKKRPMGLPWWSTCIIYRNSGIVVFDRQFRNPH
jgi:hypothetical protein